MKKGPSKELVELLTSGATKVAYGDLSGAVNDFTCILNLEKNDSSCGILGAAYYNRAVVYCQMGMKSNAISDYGKVLAIREAEMIYVALALNNRGSIHESEGNMDLAFKDYDTVISLKNIPVNALELALNNRAAIFLGTKRDYHKAIEDYSRVIQLPGASSEQIGWALLGRGAAYFHLRKYAPALSDDRRVIEMKDALPDQRRRARLARIGYWIARLLRR